MDVAPLPPAPDRDPPRVGAAVSLRNFPVIRDWVLADQRDLEIQDPIRPEFLDTDREAGVQEALRLLDGYTGRLSIHGPYWGVALAVGDPLIGEAVTRRLLDGVAVAEALNASQMVVHSPFLFFGGPWVPHAPGEERDRMIEQTHRVFGPVIARASDCGVQLVLENIQDQQPEPLDALVRSFGTPTVARSLDTGHAHLMAARGGPPVDGWIRASAGFLQHLHLADNDQASDRHWAPGEGGTIAWPAVWKALAELPRTPRLILELAVARIRPAAAWLAERGLAC
ncbi:MAG: sugar phosphate isomerase/epimerase family protein [Opitutales bacterium]